MKQAVKKVNQGLKKLKQLLKLWIQSENKIKSTRSTCKLPTFSSSNWGLIRVAWLR